jgi:hypothetical protein
MKTNYDEYIANDFVVFSVNIQHVTKNGTWKKNLIFPKEWTKFSLEKSYFNEDYNGMAMLTGKINGIFVLDIDNINHIKRSRNS